MYKRLLIVLILLIISAGLLTRDVIAGPPWPADVLQIRDGVFCSFSWLNENYEVITLTGPGMWVVQYINGIAQWNCHTTIDFDDETIASLDQVCWFFEEVLGFKDYCRGNGSFIWTTSTQPIPLSCSLDSGILANNATWITTPNGNTNISCHFDMSP